MDYTMNGRVQERRGNRHPFMAPHGCYQCSGDDKWVTIAVASDEQWQNFRQAIGDPAWASSEIFSNGPGRWSNQDKLDEMIGKWTIKLDQNEVMRILQDVGIAAGPVLDGEGLQDDPHLNARGFYEEVTREEVGTHLYPGSPIKLSKTPTSIRMPAPCLGEHNEYILSEIVGLSKEEIQELEDEQVIGTRPQDM